MIDYRIIWRVLNYPHGLYLRVKISLLKKMIAHCGKNVSLPPSTKFYGYDVSLGDDVIIGYESIFMCAGAGITIGDKCMLGPRVTMITGDHRIDCVGKYMFDIEPKDKKPENDLPILLEGDNWIGANSTILKGVTVGFGAVVAAGAVVTKNVAPNSIVGGVPAKEIGKRFSDHDLQEHMKLLKNTWRGAYNQ